MLASPSLLAQINKGEVLVTLTRGQIFKDTILSRFAPTSAGVTPSINCNVQNILSLGNQQYSFEIHPNDLDYIGLASVAFQYTDGFPPKVRFTNYKITYVNSIVRAKPDFVVRNNTSTLSILPLSNDFSSDGEITLVDVVYAGNGSFSIAGDTVFYNNAVLEDDFLVYAISNQSGEKASGTVFIKANVAAYTFNDTMTYTIRNTDRQWLSLPYQGLVLDVSPTKGTLSIINDTEVYYLPTSGISGTDIFTYTHPNGSTLRIEIKLLSVSNNTSSVRDDRFYTAKNTAITFDVLDNDLSINFPVSAFSAGLVRDTLGVFTYAPPANYSGVKNFTYTVNYGGGNTAVGKIAIYVGNYEPQQDVNYNFKTDKNIPVVIEYNAPIAVYNFEVLTPPLYGTLEFFNNASTINIDCNEINSRATIIYTPDLNYYGSDEFDVKYCVANNPCIIYKVNVDILDSDQDSLCKCVGKDCVWAGDMNGDGRVSVSDILSLGRFLGLSGSLRDDLDYGRWAGQGAIDWGVAQPNGLDIKHIDADGDGVINASDFTAIEDNYTAIHTMMPKEVLGIKDYPFSLVPNTTEVDSGDLLVIDIVVGSNNKPLVNVFGLAFALNISPSFIDSSSLEAGFDKSSWFTRQGGSLQLSVQPQSGRIEMGLTKAGGIVVDEASGFKPLGASGNGSIGQVSFIVVDEASGFKSETRQGLLRIHTGGIEIEDTDGVKYYLEDSFIDIVIKRNNKTSEPTEDKLLVFPNPTTDIIQLHFNGRNTIKSYKMVDMMGRTIVSQTNVESQSTTVNTSQLETGIYSLQVITTQGVITKKVQKIK